MRDDTHGYTRDPGRPNRYPRKPYFVIERVRDEDGSGKRTDWQTGNLRYAIDRRDDLRGQGRPAYVEDVTGRRVETWLR